jgi:antitoxin component of RelBE/YafQ-DinJ toxin-antitoxin module
MRTISIRLDDHTDAVLADHCRRYGLTQTDAIKTAIEQLAAQHRPTPAELAVELGLVGGFRSTETDLAQNHSQRLKERLRAKRTLESTPLTPSQGTGPKATRRRSTAD